MNYYRVDDLLKNAPVFQVIRKKWVALAISFLHQEFKEIHQLTVSQNLFIEHLDHFLDELRTNELFDQDRTANEYLQEWRDAGLIYIRANVKEGGYLIQLTADAEHLITWLDELHYRPIVGTESRFMNLYSLVEDITIKGSEDPQIRLAQLEEQRDRLDREIMQIQQTGQVDTYTGSQLRERLTQIQELARQMLSDFVIIEDRARSMAREIQQAQLNPEAHNLKDQTDEQRYDEKVAGYVRTLEDLGFLKRHDKADANTYIIRPLLKAKINLEVLEEMKAKFTIILGEETDDQFIE